MAWSNSAIGILVILLTVAGRPGLAAEGQSAKEITLNFSTLSKPGPGLSAKAPAPDQTLAVAGVRRVPGAPPRQRSKKISPYSLVVTALDGQGQEVARYVIPDPRLLRAEDFSPSGTIRGGTTYYRNEVQFSLVIPDDPRIKRLQIFQPHWNGQNFDLERRLGEVPVP
jgi:hypothetical protein